MRCINCGTSFEVDKCPHCGLTMRYNKVLYRYEERQTEKREAGHAAPRKKKKKKSGFKKALGIGLAVIGALVLVAAIFGEPADEQAGESGNPSSTPTASSTLPPITKEELIGKAENLDYKDLLRNPEDYVGKYIIVTVKISQVLDGGWLSDGVYYVGYTDNDGSNFYFDDQYCFLDARVDNDTKLLEDDILTIYGVFEKLETFEQALTGLSSEIPLVSMLYVDFGESAEDESAKITLEEYEKIETGMTYEDVVAIVGGEGKLSSETDLGMGDEYVTKSYTWKGTGTAGSSATVMFQDGEVSNKMQISLE